MGVDNISVLSDKQPTLPKCSNCGHPADWHRADDADNTPITDPDRKFRCIGYDCEVGGPIGFCQFGCPDYMEKGGALENLHNVFEDSENNNLL